MGKAKQAWHTGTCPSCRRSDWCQQSSNGVYICRRGPASGLIERQDRSGVPYWLFLPEGTKRLKLAPSPPAVARATPQDLQIVYGTLLERLGLSSEHLARLTARGMSEEVVTRHCFRTWPPTRGEKRAFAAELYREFGEICRRVPGWYVQDGKPMLSGGSGWILPMWDLETGCVCALRMRSDSDTGPKYYWVSSGGAKGGATSGLHARLAWPGRHPGRSERADLVRITEGEVKSIIVAERTGVPTISVPGVANWRQAIPWLKWLSAKKVLICFDADFKTNPNVARALLDAKKNLAGYGFHSRIETWRKKNSI
jgi:Domain of unknown function (DUF3854)